MFDYSYFCGANVRISVIPNSQVENKIETSTNDPSDPIDVIGVNYSINYNPQPIYGYCSTYFNAVLKGRELAQGTLLLHSNFISYFFKQISGIDQFDKFKDPNTNLYNIDLVSLGSFDIKIEFGSSFQKTNSGIIIRDCFILNKGRNIQVSADAIVEEYGFFGREINSYNSEDEEKVTRQIEEEGAKAEEEKQKLIQEKPNASEQKTTAFKTFYKNLLKAKDLKIETNSINTEELVAYNDSNNQNYSIDIKKEISLFNPETKVVAYSAPFYSKTTESKNKVPQKVLNARLINDLLNALNRYGSKSNSNELFIKDKKALELILAKNFKNISDPVLKTKQINSVLWSQLNSLRNSYDLIADNLDSPSLLEKDYSKNEAYIVNSGIQRIVNNFFNGNYSNNIGLCDKFFYEDSENKPETILTNQNDAMYVDNMIFYLDLNLQQAPIATNIYFQNKKTKYKEYYEQLWNTTPNFIKG
jgi:hypothetical protein